MAPVEKKRVRTRSAEQARKRSKVYHDGDHVSQRQSIHNSSLLTPDELPWVEVPLSGGLHDAGGFLGLQEVKDIEVLNESSGTLKYKLGRPRTITLHFLP